MESGVDYMQVGRFIYGFNRIKGSFDRFCGALEPGTTPITAETPVREVADRAEAELVQRYGAESPIVREFLEVSKIMRSGDDRLTQIKGAMSDLTIPADAETDQVLGCQQKLDHIRQLMNAA